MNQTTAPSSHPPRQPDGADDPSACCHHASRRAGMHSLRMTNWLLLGIFLTLLAHLLEMMSTPALAEVYLPKERIDSCITEHPNDKPSHYLHVVIHNS